jgi:hypothetical protein
MIGCTQAAGDADRKAAMGNDVFKITLTGCLMHVLISILLILGFIFVFLIGLMSVLRDLISISIYQPPSEFEAGGGPQELARGRESDAAMAISQLSEP